MEDLAELRRRVEAAEWYHSIELKPGLVTPGWFDTRDATFRIPWPDVRGARCLDVGTFDGFWAFEMERRGAAEVVAVDVVDPNEWDWPHGSAQSAMEAIAARKTSGDGFAIAREALGSGVERLDCNAYDLDPGRIGMFDVVYVGSILIHLRDPVRALERVRSVCRGRVVSVDTIDPLLTLLHPSTPMAELDGRGRPWWWRPNVAGHRRMVEAAGFEVERTGRLLMRAGVGQDRMPLDPRLLRTRDGRVRLRDSRIGDPHSVIVAHPVP
ncbi:MAG: methyltransferase domain-containing protein [Acidimicrobiales bacterium]